MPDMNERPPAIKAGQPTLSARSLNKIREAAPRLITGGNGIDVKKLGDRFIVNLKDSPGAPPSTIAIVTVISVEDEYIVCDKDGATINVAKPWALRKEADWPSVKTYVYTSAHERTASEAGEADEEQSYPDYEEDEELLVVRLPSARINDVDDNKIVWHDLNAVGRTWSSPSTDASMVGVKAATTTNDSLTGTASRDGVSISAGMKVLVWKQTDTTKNGVYEAGPAAWTKLFAFDSSKNVITGPNVGMVVGVAGGTLYGQTFILWNGGTSFIRMTGVYN